jgi:hypothetical protein
MGRLAAEFTMAYPEVTLEVTTEDRAVDLVTRVDAILHTQFPDRVEELLDADD